MHPADVFVSQNSVAQFSMAILAGLAIAAPVGPIGIICIRRTLDCGFARGFASGLGAATADGCYGLIAAVSMTSAIAAIIPYERPINLSAALLLLKIGVDTLFCAPRKCAEESPPDEKKNLFSAFFSTLFLTLLNPMTIISFIAVFASLGLKETESARETTYLTVLGIFLGSLIWWLFLCTAVAKVRTKLSGKTMRTINRLSGLIIIGFGIACLSKLRH